jgi:putative acetyltransferase
MTISIRPIQPSDNQEIAVIIRDALTEFNAAHPGTVYFDPTTDSLYQLFREPGSHYFIATAGEKLLGGGGYFPTTGLPPKTCELVKMYLRPEARGTGLGSRMIEDILQHAHAAGYEQIYLETMPELKPALKTYARFGFEYLKAPLGNSGHDGCSLWMLRKL